MTTADSRPIALAFIEAALVVVVLLVIQPLVNERAAKGHLVSGTHA